MAEIYHTETGRRVFDAFIDGERVLTDLDLVKDIGAAFTARDYVFTKEVSDGVLNISFVAKVDKAKISGITVIADSFDNADPAVPSTAPIAPNPIIVAPPVETPAGGGEQECVSSAERLLEEVNAATDSSNQTAIVLCDGTLTLSQAVKIDGKSFVLSSESGSSTLSGGSSNRIFIGAPQMASFIGIKFVGDITGVSDDDSGGALYVLGGDVTIDNCVFENNKARKGAAIYVDNGAAVNIVGSTFSSNYASQVSFSR
jgi:predicted outer membrane repeat protein